MALRPKGQALNISPARMMMVVKKKIVENLGQSKKIFKYVKSKVSLAPKPKAKRKLITHDGDSNKTPSPSSAKNPRTTKLNQFSLLAN